MKRYPYICSKWYPWLVELGYPQLDVVKYDDGEWAVIEYYRTPVIPSLTPWKVVLSGMRHLEISKGFLKKYIDEIDLQKKAIWEREERRTQKMLAEKEAQEQAAHDRVDTAFKAIRYNPDLMERIAKNGLSEMNLDKIARHVPSTELAAQRKSYNASI